MIGLEIEVPHNDDLHSNQLGTPLSPPSFHPLRLTGLEDASFKPLSSTDDPSRVFVFSLGRPLSSSEVVDDSARTGMWEGGDEGEGSSVEGRRYLSS